MKQKIFSVVSTILGIISVIITVWITKVGISDYYYLHTPGHGTTGDTIFPNHPLTPSTVWILIFGVLALCVGLLSKESKKAWKVPGIVLGSISLALLLGLYILYSI